MNTATAVTHQVILRVDESGKYVTAKPKRIEAVRGDKFQAQSKEGKIRLVFEPWPFKEPSVNDTVDTQNEFTFEKLGDFEFYCYLPPYGSTTELAYAEGSGGNGIVRG